MRRFVFILMIALLPLRGWMGEAMATEMATINLIAIKAINTPATAKLDTKNNIFSHLETAVDTAAPSVAMPADCEMHAKSTSEAVPAKQLCSHCQACHAVGLADTVQIISADSAHTPASTAYLSRFASAPRALGQKPPIL